MLRPTRTSDLGHRLLSADELSQRCVFPVPDTQYGDLMKSCTETNIHIFARLYGFVHHFVDAQPFPITPLPGYFDVSTLMRNILWLTN